MGTFSTVRCAQPLALLLVLLALLLHGDAASTTHRELQNAAELLRNDAFWAHETDEVSAAIAKRVEAAGYTYGYARWWLAERCPRRGVNGTLDGITKRCYDRGLRSLEKQARPRPPPPEESPEDEARRHVLWILTCCPRPMDPWPRKILNPVIKTRLRSNTPLFVQYLDQESGGGATVSP